MSGEKNLVWYTVAQGGQWQDWKHLGEVASSGVRFISRNRPVVMFVDAAPEADGVMSDVATLHLHGSQCYEVRLAPDLNAEHLPAVANAATSSALPFYQARPCPVPGHTDCHTLGVAMPVHPDLDTELEAMAAVVRDRELHEVVT